MFFRKIIFIKISLLLITFCRLFSLETSDSNNVVNNFNFKVKGSSITQFGAETQNYIIPNFLALPSDSYYSNIRNRLPDKLLRNVTDNPLIHGAAYIDFNLGFKYHGISISTNLIAEHRGISYGPLSTKSMIVFPKYKFAFDTSIGLFDDRMKVGGSIGNYDNLKLYEGLTIYNMDCQGAELYLNWKNIKFQFISVGDLVNGIGLNLDATLDWILSVHNLKITDNVNMDIQLGYFENLLVLRSRNSDGFYISANLYNEKIQIYSQFSVRDLNNLSDLKWRSAFLIGIKSNFENENMIIGLKGEIRYYGSNFNKDYYDHTVSFRKMPKTSEGINPREYSYNNTIGDNLYPLYAYERPFSQWAVYTEYQKKNALGLVFLINSKYYFYDKLFANADFDLNFIRASYEPGFWYPFYNIGLGWEPVINNFINLSFTNKGMNLDKHYPTFYLYDSPNIMINLHFDFELIKGK